jgi:hypothetical protein
VGTDSSNISTHHAMQQRVMQEQKTAERIIVSEIHQLLHDAATLTTMQYCCKQTHHMMPCISSKDIRQSWLQDGSEANLQRLAWIFYYYGGEVHQFGRSSLTHCEWVEQKVLTAMNVSYVHLAELEVKQHTCVQQLYNKQMNNIRSNILRTGPAMQHASMVKREQPKLPGLFKKNFKRGKTTFFVTINSQDITRWNKVSDMLGRSGMTGYVLTYLRQVDYAKDNRWIMWTQNAIKRFVERQNVFVGCEESTRIHGYENPAKVVAPARESCPQEWVQSGYNAAHCMEAKPDLFEMDTLFGSSIQEVNLEDTMWELTTVSMDTKAVPKFALEH